MVKRRFDVNHVEERVWARCDDSDATFLMRFYVVGFAIAPWRAIEVSAKNRSDMPRSPR